MAPGTATFKLPLRMARSSCSGTRTLLMSTPHGKSALKTDVIGLHRRMYNMSDMHGTHNTNLLAALEGAQLNFDRAAMETVTVPLGVCNCKSGSCLTMQAQRRAATSASLESVWHCRYDFTKWAVSLNAMSPGLEKLLPPSDMRWRKDVRALEEGRYGQV